jgi:hypothetical protein
MNQSLVNTLRLKLDDWRVRQHFAQVERTLRAKDVSHLPPALRQVRQDHLNRLHAYAARGVFPRNYERPNYAPCFIDRDGRECAVAHLMIVSGHSDAAHTVATVANYASVPQMTFPELDEWASETGLSKEELALIQPIYDPCQANAPWAIPELCSYLMFAGTLGSTALVGWIIGIVISGVNAVQIMRKRDRLFVPAIGLVVALLLLIIGVALLFSLSTMYELAADPNYAGQASRILREVAGFKIDGLIVLALRY